MAHYEQQLTGDVDALVAHLDQAIPAGSVSAKFEDGYDHTIGDARMVVRVYERYSAFGGNRVSLSISILAVGHQLALTATTAGGSQAMFFKLNTVGEEAFLSRAVEAIEAFAPLRDCTGEEADDGLSPRSEGTPMSKTSFTVHTTLSPSEVLTLITDFGPDRAKNWPNIDEAHFKVHDQGPDWAEVTEGTSMGWERERYSWDAAAGTIAIDTLDSNLWGPGSGWRYQLTGADGGTDLHVSLTRKPNSWKGRIVGALIPVVGASALGRQFKSVLRKAESR